MTSTTIRLGKSQKYLIQLSSLSYMIIAHIAVLLSVPLTVFAKFVFKALFAKYS